MITEILKVGDPRLRQVAEEIINITHPTLQKLIDSLVETALSANGVGIAAPQIAQGVRLFIVASRPNPRYPDAPKMEPIAMINPQIINHCSTIIKGPEGCLSVPGKRGLVPRYQTIEVEYCDRDGKLQQQQLTNFLARIFQHELDHLNGILFIDRIEHPEDLYDLDNQGEIAGIS